MMINQRKASVPLETSKGVTTSFQFLKVVKLKVLHLGTPNIGPGVVLGYFFFRIKPQRVLCYFSAPSLPYRIYNP